MIWRAMKRYGDKRPQTMERLIALLVGCLVAYAILAAVTTVLTEQGRESCERGNASRLIEFRKAAADKSVAEVRRAIYRGRHDQELAVAMTQEVEAAEGVQAGLVSLAEQSNHQTTKDAVTISCTEVWPRPIPWVEGNG